MNSHKLCFSRVHAQCITAPVVVLWSIRTGICWELSSAMRSMKKRTSCHGSVSLLPVQCGSGLLWRCVSTPDLTDIFRPMCKYFYSTQRWPGGLNNDIFTDGRYRLWAVIILRFRETTSQASYPHINLSVPVSTVLPVIKRYIDIQGTRTSCLCYIWPARHASVHCHLVDNISVSLISCLQI